MSAMIIDGKAIAAAIREEAKAKAESLKARGIIPSLSVILVGDDPASQIYVRNKGRACDSAGIVSNIIRMPADTSQRALMEQITALNGDATVSGILVQLPLPAHLDEAMALELIDPRKDVDGLHPMNAGYMALGMPGIVSCTPKGCIELLKRSGIKIAGANAVVVGRSNIVGKPMAMLLLKEHATMTICHSRTADLGQITRQADILVVAAGRQALITEGMVKPGAAVLDVGTNRGQDGKLRGDVDFEGVSRVAGWITPVPRGVGPMTIAMLLMNTLEAAGSQGV